MSSVTGSGLNSPCVATPCIENTKIANCQEYAPTESWLISFTGLQAQLEQITSPHVSGTLRKDGTSSEAPLRANLWTPLSISRVGRDNFPQTCKQELPISKLLQNRNVELTPICQ